MKHKYFYSKLILLLLFSFVSKESYAQNPIEEKGMSVITQSAAEAYIRFLASDELSGREAGTREARVAGEFIASTMQLIGLNPVGNSWSHPFQAYNRERQLRQRFQVHPDSIELIRQGTHQILSMNNILGMIEGKRTDEIVIVGAHYDHLGIDKNLSGDQIYNGADDNASGVSAVLQLAKAFMATGEQPQRTVIFACWDGEEKGLLGSKHFTYSFSGMKNIKGYLNFDMIGRNNNESKPTHVIYFYTQSNPQFGEWLKKDIQTYQLNLKPDYRPWDSPVSGSDNASFAVHGIPIIWYHTDGHPDYHQPGDHTEKINWDKLVEITKASFLTLWKLANESDL